jgi:hypothetical protein
LYFEAKYKGKYPPPIFGIPYSKVYDVPSRSTCVVLGVLSTWYSWVKSDCEAVRSVRGRLANEL